MTGFEWMLLGLVKAAVAGAVAGVVMALVCLHWEQIRLWFQNRLSLLLSNPASVGFSMQQRMNNGDYQTVCGVFDPVAGQLLDKQVVHSRQIDPQLAELHQENEMVVIS